MIILIAAAVATTVPAATPRAPEALASAQAACPALVTPEAMVCRALAAQKQGDSEASAQSFEQAAQASSDKEAETARLWAAAGNMWIAAGRAGKAAFALDRALALPGLVAEQRGEALLDRARAAEALDDFKTASAKLDEAAPMIGTDPFYWYFSAAVAVREQNLGKAQTAIGKALNLAPADPTILFQAGRIAQLSGDVPGARAYWTRAVELDPKGAAGAEAQGAINTLPAPLTVKAEPEPQPRR